jgi:ATP-dependent DNA helicase RecG
MFWSTWERRRASTPILSATGDKYHYRSYSTKQELKGPALSTFLLQKQGKRWYGLPLLGVTATGLSAEASDLLRQRAAKVGV